MLLFLDVSTKAGDTESLPLQLEFTPLHHHQLQPKLKSVLIIRP